MEHGRWPHQLAQRKIGCMSIELTLQLEPPSVFGLPEDNLTVLPANESGETRVISKVLDTRTGQFADHGTLSRYRLEGEMVNGNFEIDGVRFILRDNFLTATSDAIDGDFGLQTVKSAVNTLLGHVSLTLGALIEARVLGILINGKLMPPKNAQELMLANFRIYQTTAVTSAFVCAADASVMVDDRLNTAVDYFSAALQVQKATQSASALGLAASGPLVVAEFLTLWKAICAVIGDPARRKDRYQSRYRSCGVSDQLKSEVDELKAVRDTSDVAHYSLDPKSLAAVQSCIGKTRRVAAAVLKAYRDTLCSSVAADGASQTTTDLDATLRQP